MSSPPIVVVVRYRVNGMSTSIPNVNVQELQMLLVALFDRMKNAVEPADEFDAFSKVLWITPAESQKYAALIDEEEEVLIQGAIDQLVLTDNLSLPRNVKCDFFERWWKSKSPAATVICLLEAAISAQKHTEQALLDAKLRSFGTGVIGGQPPATEDAAKRWLENWNREHGIPATDR